MEGLCAGSTLLESSGAEVVIIGCAASLPIGSQHAPPFLYLKTSQVLLRLIESSPSNPVLAAVPLVQNEGHTAVHKWAVTTRITRFVRPRANSDEPHPLTPLSRDTPVSSLPLATPWEMADISPKYSFMSQMFSRSNCRSSKLAPRSLLPSTSRSPNNRRHSYVNNSPPSVPSYNVSSLEIPTFMAREMAWRMRMSSTCSFVASTLSPRAVKCAARLPLRRAA
ncbi:hypothetical protein EDB84DRAFT_353375 [Lactarius hengduanensis]|nr:hypothetical protein EDB84DRAFT_353375 [Lactarius hengduanensis]